MASSPERLMNADALESLTERDSERFISEANKFLALKHPTTIRSHVLLEQMSNSFGDREYSRALCTQLVAIATIRRIESGTVEETFDKIAASMKTNGISEDARNWFARVRGEFNSLLKSQNVRLVAKALHLSTDYQDLYTNANIVTDIRPVFDSLDQDVRENVVGGMITQSLRIYFISGERNIKEQEISLSLDIDDIEKLIKELNKAKSKSDAAKRFLGEKLSENAFVVGEDTYGFG